MAMRPEFSDRAFKALRIICQASEPMGAGSLARSMTERGDPVSMATAGRTLWELDEKGYVEKVSNKGRILSAKGREYLKKLEAEGKNNTLAQELLEELYMRTPRDLLDILVARRAIERETARLATLKATKEDLEQIRAFAEILDGDRSQVPSISVIDRLFHEAIASAGKNKVLLATLKLVRQDVNTQQIFTFIRQQEGSRLGGDHMPIFLAIAGRDPEDAEKAMLRHIDNIIRDVEHYCGGANPHTDPALR
ncbi:MAG TPA: GntR family transcriptional regulator [Synergistaceae bacterium]|jgi:GntR family L-lactate dehydrogenase operon transcriptional regulator|nr:GntR family transcriptional regulator [Synergistaceae bacterium]